MSIDFAGPRIERQGGLLEQPVLWVGAPDTSGRRWLEDGSGAVGFSRASRRWWPWGRGVLVVHEAFEEPIVFRVRRLWTLLPRWLVLDSEGETVGVIAPSSVRDRWNRLLYRRVRRLFVNADRLPVAEWCADGGRDRLTLREPVRDDPFAKMLLLAAVLLV